MSKVELRASHLKRLPLWLRILLVGIALVVVAGLVIPYFLDVDRYRTLIASVIENETGRKVTIGKIRARLLPSVGFVAEDFHLSNPPSFPQGDVLSAEAIRGNLAWGPLLRREFRLSAVELLRPKLVLLEDDRGQTNYSFRGFRPPDDPGGRAGARLTSRETKRALEKSNAATSGNAFRLSEIERVDLTDAEVILARVGHSRTVVPSLHARKINAELSHVALDPARLKRWQGDARLDGVLLELSGWKDPIAFRSGRLRLREGRIESEFRAGLGKVVEAKGSLHVADVERGVVTFELSTPQLDVDSLVAMEAASSGGPPRSSSGQHELVAQGRLVAERLRWQPYMANNGTAEIRIFTDRIELWPVTVELYGGTLQISARADRTQTPERFSSNVQIRNLDVGKMLAASTTTRGKISGTGEVNLQLFGALSSDWRRSLSGAGNFAIRDGRLPGINLPGPVETLAKLEGMGGATPFSVIQGDLSIKQGRVWSQLIHMDSPRGTADLHGSCGLDGTLDYDGQVVLVPGANTSMGGGDPSAAGAIAGILGGVLKRNVSRADVPISIRGTLAEPKIHPGRGLPDIQQPAPGQSPLKKAFPNIFPGS